MQNHNEAANRYIAALKGEIIAFFRDEDIRVVLFGSRARGDNHPAADVDIGIIPSGELDNTRIALLHEKIEALNIPYKVEVVNLAEVSKSFEKEALE